MAARRGYSERLAGRICQLIADGENLRSISEMSGMPPRRTVRDWLAAHPDFERRYELARRERTDNLVDEAIAIADSVAGTDNGAAVQAAKLQIDTRRWLAAKLLPERFGERVEHVGPGGQALIPPETDRSKVALVLLGILSKARPPVEIDEAGEEAAVLEPSPEPRRLLLSDEPRDVADLVVEPDPPPPNPRWTKDAQGQTRHVSEQQLGLFPLRVVK